MPGPTKCIPFARAHGRRGQARVTTGCRTTLRAELFSDIFDHLSPAQYAFLSGVLAILAEHGEDALTRSCEMVIERFKRGQAG